MEHLVHQHLLYQAQVGNNFSIIDVNEKCFKMFLIDLVEEIEMKILIPPSVKLSENNAWTGIIGIITSHIAFHYWVSENYLQLDIYSCKPFDIQKATDFLNKFWNAQNVKILDINRASNNDFTINRHECL